MKYISTRGGVAPHSFKEVVLKGLADDGGLFVPRVWPKRNRTFFLNLQNKTYSEVAFEIFKLFVGNDVEENTLKSLLEEAYMTFNHEDIVPLKKLKDDLYLLELFHGPTLAFKDIAIQALARLMEYFITGHEKGVTVFAATSGDTGAAAVAALENRQGIEAFILHPAGRISEIQRRQMTTCSAPNVNNIAIEGNFDDCQNLLKKLLSDLDIKANLNPTTINSINWARVLAQVVYYIYSGLQLGPLNKPINFIVPSGNFGNAFSALVANKIGFPMGSLIIATNENDILSRAFNKGEYKAEPVQMTHSPAMDIQVSSNFERHLFDCFKKDGDAIINATSQITNGDVLTLRSSILKIRPNFIFAESVSNTETLKFIKKIWVEFGEIIDPHTAVGMDAEERCKNLPGINVVLSTAHPAKFPETVFEAIGLEPEIPTNLKGILDCPENYTTLPNDFKKLKDFIMKVGTK